MDPEDRVCGHCGQHTAEICGQIAPRCENCMMSHTQYQHHHYLQRTEALERLREQARQSLSEVDRAMVEVRGHTQRLQTALISLCEEKLTHLQEVRNSLERRIQQGLEEVEDTLMKEQPFLSTELGPIFRDNIEGSELPSLFTFTVSTCSSQTLLHLDIQLASEPSNTLLPGVYKKWVKLYDVKTRTFTKHTLSVDFGSGGSYVELGGNKLLCVGARPASSAVYLLDLVSFQLSALPPLFRARRAAGIAKVNSRIYVLGGLDTDGRGVITCEKMHLSDKKWSSVRTMMAYPRCGFTPCVFHSLLYLVSANLCARRTIETFDTETEEFAVLSVPLPLQLTSSAGSVAFIVNGELCFLTQKLQMARWRIDKDQDFRLSPTSKLTWSNQQPWVRGSQVIIASGSGFDRFSLVTYCLGAWKV